MLNNIKNKGYIFLFSIFLNINKILAAKSELMPDETMSLDDNPANDNFADAFDPTGLPTENLWLVYRLIVILIQFVFGLIGTIAVLMIIYGGFKYVTGSLSGKEEGKQTIKNALLGIVIALISYFIVSVFLDALTTVTS